MTSHRQIHRDAMSVMDVANAARRRDDMEDNGYLQTALELETQAVEMAIMERAAGEKVEAWWIAVLCRSAAWIAVRLCDDPAAMCMVKTGRRFDPLDDELEEFDKIVYIVKRRQRGK